MLEVDQISLISTAEIHLRKLFLHLLHFPCCFIVSQYGMEYQSMSLTFNITLAQFFSEDGSRLDLTDEQSEILEVWDGLDVKEKEILLSFIRSLKK